MQKQAKGLWSLLGRGLRAPANVSVKVGRNMANSAISRAWHNGKPMIKLEPRDLHGLAKAKHVVGTQLLKHPYLYGYGVPTATTAAAVYGAKKINDATTPWYGPLWDTTKEYAGKAGDWIKENPGTAGLIGAGLIGVPLLSALFDDDDDDDRRPRRSNRW